MNNNNDGVLKVKPEFVEQPIDAYITKTPATIRCTVKNAVNFHIECNNKIVAFKNETIEQFVCTYRKLL